MDYKNSFSCIITAAGLGTRFKAPEKKQFITLKNKPILFHTIELFYNLKEIKEIIVTLPEDDLERLAPQIKNDYPKINKIIIGGINRQESVYRALINCNQNNYVIIQDGVRPFLDHNDLKKMMSLVKKYKAVIPGNKIKNTLKKINLDRITDTISRDDIIEVFTPQVFERELIMKYHELAKDTPHSFTDDASILEHYNQQVFWYHMVNLNLKITTKEDYELALLYIEKKEKKNG